MIIDANNQSRVLNVTGGSAVLDGLEITRGNAGADDHGGGVYVASDASLAVTNATLSANIAQYGGGVSNSGTVTFTDTTVRYNTAMKSGGGVLNFGDATLTNTTVSGNSAWNSGGGVSNSGTATLTNATVSGNFTDSGGGVENIGTATLTSTTVSGNNASDSGGGIFTERQWRYHACQQHCRWKCGQQCGR